MNEQVTPVPADPPVLFTFEQTTTINYCKHGGCILTQGDRLYRPDPEKLDTFFEKGFTNLDDLIQFLTFEKNKLENPMIFTAEQAIELSKGNFVPVPPGGIVRIK